MYKALSMGYKVRVVRDALSFVQRRTRRNVRKALAEGKAVRALGYYPLYMLLKFGFLTVKYGLRYGVYYVCGSLSSYVPYEESVRRFVWCYTRSILANRFRSFLSGFIG